MWKLRLRERLGSLSKALSVAGGCIVFHARSLLDARALSRCRGFMGTLCSWCALLGEPPGLLCFSSGQLNQIPPLHNQQMWVIDMVCLHNMNLIAIASTDQKIGEPLAAALACSRPLGLVHLFPLGEICRQAGCEHGLPLLLSLPRVL